MKRPQTLQQLFILDRKFFCFKLLFLQVSGYASMPISPYPSQQYTHGIAAGVSNAVGYKSAGGPDVHSQTSSNDGSSGSEQRRGLVLQEHVQIFIEPEILGAFLDIIKMPYSTQQKI